MVTRLINPGDSVVELRCKFESCCWRQRWFHGACTVIHQRKTYPAKEGLKMQQGESPYAETALDMHGSLARRSSCRLITGWARFDSWMIHHVNLFQSPSMRSPKRDNGFLFAVLDGGNMSQ